MFEEQLKTIDGSVESIEKAIREVESFDQEGEEGLNKERYQRLKEDISRIREAKQRILSRGYPELRPNF